jgi:hypothetical protein
VRLLRASITGEASACGECARGLGRQARERINADFNVDDTPPRASQKLVAAATLLRAMPAPSSPEARNLHREVVGFWGAYHAILGRSCYAKFMAVPNYTYLKMKMSGRKGVITVGSSIEHAFDCDVECVEHAEALALDEELVANLEKLVNEDLDSTAKHADSFEATEQTKEVPLDPTAPEGKALRVSSTLDPK